MYNEWQACFKTCLLLFWKEIVKMIRKNLKIYYIRGALYSIAMLFFAGGLTQTFLLEAGVSDHRVSIYVAVMQVAECAAMILVSGPLEKRTDLIQLYGRYHLLLLPMALTMIIVCFFPGMGAGAVYTLMMIGGVLTYIAIGFIGILEYKLPYLIINMNEYGSIMAVGTVVTGVATLTSSMLISAVVKGRDFISVIGYFIIPAALMVIIVSRMTLDYREVSVNAAMTASSGKKINLLNYKPFQLLALPNLLRGFSTGTFNLFTTIGYHLGFIDTVTATYMVTIGNIVIFAVGIFYQKAAKWHKDTLILLIAGFLMLVVMPLAFIGGNVKFFLCMYVAAFFLKTIFEYISPVAIVPILDYEIVGQFTAWRLSLYLAGIALSGVLAIPMVDAMGVIPAMITNGLCFALSGVAYYVVVKSLLKEKQKNKSD